MERAYRGGFDAHTHLDAFDDIEGVLAAARRAGVSRVVVSAADPARWQAVVDCASQPGVWFTAGVHPWWPDTSAILGLVPYLAHPRCVGLGEVGLDHARARDASARRAQRELLEAQLALAGARPVVLHCVRAFGALLDAVAEHRVSGMVHDWSGGVGPLKRALDLGLYLSVGPGVSRSSKQREAVVRVPSDRLLLETDSPGRPGQAVQPADLIAVAELVAELRGEDPAALLAHCGENAALLFGL